MTLHALVVDAFAVLTLGAGVGALGLLAALAVPAGRSRLRTFVAGGEAHLIAWAWIVALVATAGSLYFSAGAGFRPCHLCWYQRIAMYPLVLILGVGMVRTDAQVWRYALPLPLAGLPISVYHVVLQHRPALDLIACEASNPCSLRYVTGFGFVSIPMMAGAAFLLLLGLLGVLALGERPSGRAG